MFKKVMLITLFVCIAHSSFGQITSNEGAEEALNWIIENPQMKSDSLFVEKSAAVIKYNFENHSQVEMRSSGIGEFMETSGNYKFFREVTLIYMLSEMNNQVNKNVSKNQSAFISISNVLKFYQNILLLNENYKNVTLDNYATLSEKELRKKIKNLR